MCPLPPPSEVPIQSTKHLSGKKSSRFLNCNFGAKKFFTENRVFFLFLQKNWKKYSYFWKRKVSFKREKWVKFFDVKSMEIEWKLRPEKFVKRKRKINRYSRKFRRIFTKLSEIVSLAFSRRCPKRRKHPSYISADARGFVEKSDF